MSVASSLPTTISLELPEAPETDDNAELVHHWHNVARQLGEGMVEAAARAGDALHEQRCICKQEKKNFKFWCEQNLKFSHKTATTYMKIAANWSAIEQVKRASPDEPLSIRQAVRLIDEQQPKPDPRDRHVARDVGRQVELAVARVLCEVPEGSEEGVPDAVSRALDSWRRTRSVRRSNTDPERKLIRAFNCLDSAAASVSGEIAEIAELVDDEELSARLWHLVEVLSAPDRLLDDPDFLTPDGMKPLQMLQEVDS